MLRSKLKTLWLGLRVGGESTIETKAARVLSVANEGVDDEEICFTRCYDPTAVARHVDANDRVPHCRKSCLCDLANGVE